MSATPGSGQQRGDLPQRWAPADPEIALVPGMVLALLGVWSLTEGELPSLVGWAGVAVGAAFLITGAVAKGVAWGLALHQQRER